MPEPAAQHIHQALATGTILAFDFGLKRIGVAVGESLLGQARPLTTLALDSNDARFAAIQKLIAEWQPACLVVGLPRSVDGEAHAMTARCERFACQLEGRFRLPVERVDERYTSAEAEHRLASRGQAWQQRKETLDAEAAAIILQDFFDSRPR